MGVGVGVHPLPVERSSLESVCNASMISEKVPWEHKWLGETGGRRRCGDNIMQRPEARAPLPALLNTICPLKLNT